MNLQFIDRTISLKDIYDYTDAEYIDNIKEIFDDEDIKIINIPFHSNGIDDIILYLHGIDLWNDIIKGEDVLTSSPEDPYDSGITQNHMDIIRFLGLKPLYWCLDESKKDSFEIDTTEDTITVKDENGRECIARSFPLGYRCFSQNGYIYVYGFYADLTSHLKVFNYRLEEVHETDIERISFPITIKLDNHTPFDTEDAYIWKHLIIDPHHGVYNFKTGKRYSLQKFQYHDEYVSYILNDILYMKYNIIEEDDEDDVYEIEISIEIYPDKVITYIPEGNSGDIRKETYLL